MAIRTQAIRVALLFVAGWGATSDSLLAASALNNQPPFLAPSSAPDRGLRVLNSPGRLAYNADWRLRTQRKVPRGGHAMVILNLGEDRCGELSASRSDVTFSSFYPTYLSTPSSAGGQPGWYYEALVPRNSQSCRLSPFVLAEWRPEFEGALWLQQGTKKVEVQVRFEGHFIAPRHRFHIGLSNSYLIQGHCLSYCPLEAELGDAYRKLLLDHHLSPYHHWVGVPQIIDGRLDLDADADRGLSFRQQVMADNADRIAFPRVRGHTQPIDYLRALEQTVLNERLAGKAWVYVRDEPEDVKQLEAELMLYRTYAPSVMTLVTTPWRESLDSGIDIFAPVLHQMDGARAQNYAKKRLWPYTSCMGSCGPNRRNFAHSEPPPPQPGPDTGLPDLLIDRPGESIEQYFQFLNHVGADATLYYHAVEGYPLYRQGVLLRDDPWNFGGNGDGLLLFPGRPGELGLDHHQPLPSLRLKLLRQAIERRW